MAEAAVLRLFTFRADGNTSTIDSAIRRLAPTIAELDGVLAFYAARRGHQGGEERVLASVWESESAVRAAAANDPDERLPGEEGLGAGHVEVYPVAVIEGEERPEDGPAVILRVFRGRVREGELAAYIEDARAGARSDIAGGHGALGLYLSICGDNDFVTTSAWTGWDRIQAATGGNVSQPIATRNTSRLTDGSVQHYEIIPNAIGGRVRRPSVVD